MSRRLRTAVYVIGAAGIGSPVLLEAGSEVPAEYADQVTADSAYLADDEQTATDDAATASAGVRRGTHDPSDDGDGYAAMTVEQLRAELTRRDLPHSGTKGQLIARLEDDDEHRDDTPPNDSAAGAGSDEGSEDSGDQKLDEHDEDAGQQPES